MAERLSNGIRTVRHADWLKANRTTVYDLKAIPTPEKSVKRRLQDCDAALASDDGPIFSTVAKLIEGTVSSANQSRLLEIHGSNPEIARASGLIRMFGSTGEPRLGIKGAAKYTCARQDHRQHNTSSAFGM